MSSSGDGLRLRNKSHVPVPPTIPDIAVDPGIKLKQAGPVLLDYYLISGLVLGGCCTNVWAYEELLKMTPGVGSALTFSQMLFISLQSLPRLLAWNPTLSVLPQLKPRQVPVWTWALQVLLLTSGSILNNWAFGYNVPVSIQIVFRSAGLGISMLFGWYFLGRRYTRTQVRSVILVSTGVILATFSRPSSSSGSHSKSSAEDVRKYLLGVLMLVVSLLLTGRLGLMQEKTYKEYGPCWQEGVAYTHILSLPIFLFLKSDIQRGFVNLSQTPDPTRAYAVMAINLLSQLVCVSAVNRLSSQVSSVSTNLVLTTRKAVSLCFSVWWFGNGFNAMLGFGAAMVFGGSILFSLPGQIE